MSPAFGRGPFRLPGIGRLKLAAGPRPLHQTRKPVSDARHAAEAARAAADKKARRTSRRTKKMRGTPGDHHDAEVARDTAPDIRVRAHLAGEDAFSFGVLCAQSDRRHSGL